MEERQCSQCIWRSADVCTAWECKPITRKEVGELLKNYEKQVAKMKRKINRLEKERVGLMEMHYADQAEIIYQRRQIDFLMDAEREV